jgi:hypothetical protein
MTWKKNVILFMSHWKFLVYTSSPIPPRLQSQYVKVYTYDSLITAVTIGSYIGKDWVDDKEFEKYPTYVPGTGTGRFILPDNLFWAIAYCGYRWTYYGLVNLVLEGEEKKSTLTFLSLEAIS